MKKGKIIALALAVVVAFFVFLLLGRSKNEDDSKTVIVAAADIKAGSKIDEKALAIEKVPDKYALKGSITKIADATGKIANVDIKKGEQIINDKIIAPGSGKGGLAYKIPKGKRAVSFRITDESSLDGNIKPGNKVDVSISMPVVAPGSEVKVKEGESADLGSVTGFTSKYVVEKVEVLYVGQDTASDGTVTVAGSGDSSGSVKASSQILVLAVTPEDALKINTIKYQADSMRLGKLSVTLRSPEDDSKANSDRFSVQLLQ